MKSIATFTPLIERVLSWNLLPAISGIVSSVWSLFHVLASPVVQLASMPASRTARLTSAANLFSTPFAKANRSVSLPASPVVSRIVMS